MPLSIRASAATVSRLPSAGATDGSTSGPTTDSCSSRRTGSEASKRQSSSRKPPTASSRLPGPSTGETSSLPRLRYLAGGAELGALGPKVAVDELVRLELPSPDIGTRRIRATVLYVDRFGNVQLNLSPAHLEQVGIDDGSRVEVEVGFERYYAVAARTFAEVRRGDIVLYEDAYGNIALAINQGDAAKMFVVAVGEDVRLTAVDA